MLVLEHAAFGPAHIGVRHLLQGDRQRLDDEVVDRKLVGRLAVLAFGGLRIDLLARVEELADVAVDGEVEYRHALRRRGQPLRDGAAHAVVRHDLVAAVLVERADLLIRHCRRASRRDCRRAGRRSGRAQAAAGLCLLDVAGDDAAVRAGAFDAADIDAGVLGKAARQR